MRYEITVYLPKLSALKDIFNRLYKFVKDICPDTKIIDPYNLGRDPKILILYIDSFLGIKEICDEIEKEFKIFGENVFVVIREIPEEEK